MLAARHDDDDFEQILKAAPFETAAVQVLTSHFKNHPCKMIKVEEERTNQWTPTHGHTSVR